MSTSKHFVSDDVEGRANDVERAVDLWVGRRDDGHDVIAVLWIHLHVHV